MTSGPTPIGVRIRAGNRSTSPASRSANNPSRFNTYAATGHPAIVEATSTTRCGTRCDAVALSNSTASSCPSITTNHTPCRPTSPLQRRHHHHAIPPRRQRSPSRIDPGKPPCMETVEPAHPGPVAVRRSSDSRASPAPQRTAGSCGQRKRRGRGRLVLSRSALSRVPQRAAGSRPPLLNGSSILETAAAQYLRPGGLVALDELESVSASSDEMTASPGPSDSAVTGSPAILAMSMRAQRDSCVGIDGPATSGRHGMCAFMRPGCGWRLACSYVAVLAASGAWCT
jgi:hypothetical protein